MLHILASFPNHERATRVTWEWGWSSSVLLAPIQDMYPGVQHKGRLSETGWCYDWTYPEWKGQTVTQEHIFNSSLYYWCTLRTSCYFVQLLKWWCCLKRANQACKYVSTEKYSSSCNTVHACVENLGSVGWGVSRLCLCLCWLLLLLRLCVGQER